jgi:hypothetical protein
MPFCPFNSIDETVHTTKRQMAFGASWPMIAAAFGPRKIPNWEPEPFLGGKSSGKKRRISKCGGPFESVASCASSDALSEQKRHSVTTSSQRAYQMLDNESLWDVAGQCHAILERAAIPHAIVGGVAVCLHGYQRNTVDLDLLVGSAAESAVRAALEAAGFEWSQENAEFRSPTGIPVQFLIANDRAGAGSEVRLPDPADTSAIIYLEGLPVISLAKLIESKIACGEGNLRRTHKDFADVVELIVKHDLRQSFARNLHKSLRKTFRQLVLRARGE